MDTILYLISGFLFPVSLAAHIYVRLRLRPKPGSDLDELTKPRGDKGPWLQRLVLHERLVRKGVERGSDEYNAEYEKVGMAPLTDQELLTAMTKVRSTEYETPRASEAERLMEAFGIGLGLGGGAPPAAGSGLPGD